MATEQPEIYRNLLMIFDTGIYMTMDSINSEPNLQQQLHDSVPWAILLDAIYTLAREWDAKDEGYKRERLKELRSLHKRGRERVVKRDGEMSASLKTVIAKIIDLLTERGNPIRYVKAMEINDKIEELIGQAKAEKGFEEEDQENPTFASLWRRVEDLFYYRAGVDKLDEEQLVDEIEDLRELLDNV